MGLIEGAFVFFVAGFSGIAQLGLIGVILYFLGSGLLLALVHSYFLHQRQFPPKNNVLISFGIGFTVPIVVWQLILMLAAGNFSGQ